MLTLAAHTPMPSRPGRYRAADRGVVVVVSLWPRADATSGIRQSRGERGGRGSAAKLDALVPSARSWDGSGTFKRAGTTTVTQVCELINSLKLQGRQQRSAASPWR